jgi:hypothetical protein
MCSPHLTPFRLIGPIEDFDDEEEPNFFWNEPPAKWAIIPTRVQREVAWFAIYRYADRPAKERRFTELMMAHVMWTNGMSGIAQWTRGFDADEVDAMDFDRNTEVMVYSGQYFTGYNAMPFTLLRKIDDWE